ncbi:MAG: metallophosphoesterase [Christensenellaceae bacterium]|nr:metallophosphoesterase [Christensenellaceae bacterium]
MSLFAIGDLHLPGGDDKPMDVFGGHWEGHFERISRDWRERVGAEDTVLIPGDISWAMQLSNAVPDLRMIGDLPGRKVLCKGNHDYWWSSLTQVRSAMPEGMQPLQHSAMDLGEAVVCGTRGWMIPTQETPLSPEDEKLFKRELMRMEMALQAADKLRAGRPLVVMMHYPPLYAMERDTDFTRLFERFGVHTVVYGHLHGQGIRAGFSGEHQKVRYRLVSCDSLDFQLAKIGL